MQKLMNIVLPVLTLFKVLQWLNLPPSPLSLTQSKPDVNGVKGKNGRVYTLNFYGWPS